MFYNIASTRIIKPTGYPNDATTNPNDKVSGLNAASLKAFGPAKVLAIMEGDRVDIGTKYYYNGSQSGVPPETGGGTKRPIDWAEDGGSSEESSSGGNPPPPSSSTFQPINEILTQLSTIFTTSVSTISGGEFNQAGTSAAFGANSNLSTFLVSAFNNAVTNYPQ